MRQVRIRLVSALVILAIGVVMWAHPSRVVHHSHPLWASDTMYLHALVQFNIILGTSLLTLGILAPLGQVQLQRLRSRVGPKARNRLLPAILIFGCLFLSGFIYTFGRWQYGAFDYNILLDVGWRQVLGQRPYVDFLVSTPPLFNLGIYLAFRILGVTWDAMLILSCIFASGTFLWLFWLSRRLRMSCIAALGTAFAIETAAMLTCCFWWYNNTTLIIAAVFYMSCMVLAMSTPGRYDGYSFVVSLSLLFLAKPNVAGITIVACLTILFTLSRRRVHVLLLVLAACGLCSFILIAARVSVPAMLRAYHGVAQDRGAFSSFGFLEMSPDEQIVTVSWVLLLCVPFLSSIPELFRDLKTRQFRSATLRMFYLVAPLVAGFAIAGNGEFRDVEFTLMIVGLAVMGFGHRIQQPGIRLLTVTLIGAMVLSDLYVGVRRMRVYTIGPHQFFEWTNNRELISSGVLKGMRVSDTFVRTQQQVEAAYRANPGPIFFGPRIDCNYAVLSIPSPRGFPAWWHPGTAFDRAQLPGIIATWEADQFRTLIFLKGDYTYYPQEFLNLIRTQYTPDNHLPDITVYHRRPMP